MKSAGLLFVVVLAVAQPAAGQTAIPHRVVRVSPAEISAPAEVSVAINPADERNIVVVALGRHAGQGTSNFTFFTNDGGQSWDWSAAPNAERLIQGDDAVVFDSAGKAHRSYISFNALEGNRPGATNAIFVARSTTGGKSWDEPVAVVKHVNTATPFEDKPYLAADPGHQSPHKDNLYIAWTRFDEYGSPHPEHKSQILFSRSDDGGKSFTSPLRVSDAGGDCLDGDNTVEGCVPAVGTSGEVYLVWAGPRGLEFDRSTDGGATFGKDKVISDLPGGWDSAVEGISRHNGMPVTAVDHSPGPHRGSLYVNWIDERNGDLDVFLMATRDGGQSWSKPVRVNDDELRNGRTQFFTWMAVDPADGSVNVVFYDRRSGDGTATKLTLARSIDGGATFRNFALDLPPFETQANVFFGDYVGIAARNGLVVPAFMHFTGERELGVSVALVRFEPGTMAPGK